MKPNGKKVVVHSDRLKPYQGAVLDSWIEQPMVESSNQPGNENDKDQEMEAIPELASPASRVPPQKTVAPKPHRYRDRGTHALPPALRQETHTSAPRRNPIRPRNAPKRLIHQM